MPFSSTATGMPPSEVTQSAMVSASTSCAASQTGLAWLNMPVEVSACTNATTRGRSRRMKSRTSWGSNGSPQGFARRTTSRALAARHFADAVGEEAVGRAARTSGPARRSWPRPLPCRNCRCRRAARLKWLAVEKDVAEQRADLVRDLEEEGVEMADHVLRHGRVNTRRHHARPGSEQ